MTVLATAFSLAKPFLRRLDPETAHGLTITSLKMCSRARPRSDPLLTCKVLGLEFPNPLGLAAGFDKNAEVPDAMLALGFGAVETGSVTPRPQSGNPRPRLFRLVEDEAVINRMGFNNEGHAAVLPRLRHRQAQDGIVSVNLGANKDSVDRIGDYVEGLKAFAGVVSYVTINISSPNTPGLRTLQAENELEQLLVRLIDARRHLRKVPLVLKLAPDLTEEELSAIAAICLKLGIDGIAMSNTTILRPSLRGEHAKESGGLSGKPLFDLSTRQLARLWLLTKGTVPLIGIGGIHDANSAWIKITAGATLLQLYTALVFRGPAVIDEILTGLSRIAREQGYKHFSAAIGTRAETIAHQGLRGT